MTSQNDTKTKKYSLSQEDLESIKNDLLSSKEIEEIKDDIKNSSLTEKEIEQLKNEVDVDNLNNISTTVIEDNSIDISQNQLPSYLIEYYSWAYVKPKNIDFLDNSFIYHIILFGQGWKLMREYLKEFRSTDKSLQVAHVYGPLVKKLAKKVAVNGSLDIIDVVPYQLKKAAKKLQGISGEENIDIWLQDASHNFSKEYDTIGIYFLLHEVPDSVKKKIIENALNSINEENGKVVIIDYHNPFSLHPVRPILKLINFTLEPFSNSLWEREIKDFTNKQNEYNWEKTTYFGGVYQKVVITKK